MEAITTTQIDEILESRTTVIARDLRLNLKRILEEGALAPEESLLALLATATSVRHEALAEFAREQLRARSLPDELLQEAAESAAIVGMLNTYYKFKHYVGKDEDYRAAGLRMTALAKPLNGKERFEMLALAVSVLNGCETCIRAHEKVLRDGGTSADKIHDLARLAAVVMGIRGLQAPEAA